MGILWAEVSCIVPGEMVDQLAEFLVALSGNGVCVENLNIDAFSLDELDDAPTKTIKSYFPTDSVLQEKVAAIEAYQAELAAEHPGFVPQPLSVTTIKEEDWANSWKKNFKPARIGQRMIIKPTWEDWNRSDASIVIEIDPGMAFGTGTHATSRLCLETLERIFFREAPFDCIEALFPIDLLDVGTGSGILSIAAAKLGAHRVVAIDIDHKAVMIAQENLALNRVEGMVSVSDAPLRDVPGQFAVVVANILAEDLARMADDLVGKMRQGSILILSGILTEKEEIVLSGFAPFPLALVETTRKGEWSCITYRLEG